MHQTDNKFITLFFHILSGRYNLAILYILWFLVLLTSLLFSNKYNRFFVTSLLSNKLINRLMLLKIITGVVYIYVEQNYFNGGDLSSFHSNSLLETELLLNNPLKFITSLFNSSGEAANIFSTHSFWNYFRNIFLEKILGIFNVISFKNIYINSLLFNYLIFYGHVALYRVFSIIWQHQKIQKIVGCFLLPSSLYYLSVINKDSLFFLGIGLLLCACSSIFVLKKATTNTYVMLLVGLAICFIVRNFFFVLIIPSLLGLALSAKFKTKSLLIFGVIYGLIVIVFLSNPGILQIVVDRQHSFLQLGWAKSALHVPPLKPTFWCFVQHFPIAFDIAFLRPYVWDSYSIFYFASALETLFFLLLLFTLLLKTKFVSWANHLKSPIVLFCLFYGFSCLLIIGYTIPILGASVRYKTAFLPLLLTPLLCSYSFSNFKWAQKYFKL